MGKPSDEHERLDDDDVDVDVDVDTESTAASAHTQRKRAARGAARNSVGFTASVPAQRTTDAPTTTPSSSTAMTTLLTSKHAAGVVGVDKVSSEVDERVRRAQQQRKRERRASPAERASCCSRLTWWWFNALVRTGYRRPLSDDDMWDVESSDCASRSSDLFGQAWAVERTRAQPSVARALRSAYGLYFALAGLVKLAHDSLQYLAPMVLKMLIAWVGDAQQPSWVGWALAFGLFATTQLQSVLVQIYFDRTFRVGMRAYTGMLMAVYRKVLRLSQAARHDQGTGKIINVMSSDAQKVQDVFTYLHSLWSGPLQILVGIGMLFYIVEWASLVGVGVMVVLMPVNGVIMRVYTGIRRATMKHTDERVRWTNEILLGAKSIKLYAWEERFIEKLLSIRTLELAQVRKGVYLQAFASLIFNVTPVIVSIATLAVFAAVGGEFTPDRAFVAVTVLNIMRFPLLMIPMLINQISEARVSIARISSLLLADEMDESSVLQHDTPFVGKPPRQCVDGKDAAAADEGSRKDDHVRLSVLVDGGVFSWEGEKKEGADEKKDGAAAKKDAKAPAGKAASAPGADGTTTGAATATATSGGATDADAAAAAAAAPPAFQLREITLRVPTGSLCMVVGRVGSGKTSLLSAVVGEMHKVRGRVQSAGSLAYVGQEAWIQNMTLLDNVVFGHGYHHERFERVLHCTALRDDVALLPGGVDTEIGERGINLSGGQKQRVNLARAVYANADVYIMDDTLSAVDAHVGRHIFETCILGELRDKTRIVATHQLQYLPQSDWIVVLDGGRILHQGTYDELRRAGVDFAASLGKGSAGASSSGAEPEGASSSSASASAVGAASASSASSGAQTPRGDAAAEPGSASALAAKRAVLQSAGLVDVPSQKSMSQQQARTRRSGAPEGDASTAAPTSGSSSVSSASRASAVLAKRASVSAGAPGGGGGGASAPSAAKAGELTKAEEREVGSVKPGVYLDYARAAGSVFLLVVALLSCIVGQGVRTGSDYWVTFWTETAASGEFPVEFYVGVFVAFGVAVAVFFFLRNLLISVSALRAARRMHEQLIGSVLHAPMVFFDQTPTGRLMSRFTKDTDTVDTSLPSLVSQFLSIVFTTLGALTLIGFVSPYFLLIVAAMGVLYYFIQMYYRATSRELKRLQSISRSPIFVLFQETLAGLVPIRAFRAQERFVYEIGDRLDHYNGIYWALMSSNRWLALRLEFLGNVIVLGSALFAVGMRDNGWVSAAIAGMSVSNALAVTGWLSWLIRTTTELEMGMNSVERVQHYLKVDPEGLPDEEPAATGWPVRGTVDFKHLEVRYRPDLPPVLNDITLRVVDGQKIGVVGRTGAGKTTFVQSLFRLVEATGGVIEIDGVDISTVRLADLREQITIVPQDPVLFSGPLRTNLDPFGRYTDAELWSALDRVHLGASIRALPKALDAEVKEGGSNFSIGERQLMCLARALLKSTHILVMDEATASIDTATDAAIQETIRHAFRDCTVFTIAHRLNTIVDSDKILLLESGSVAEFAPPEVLLADKQSKFSALVDRTGAETAAKLREQAFARPGARSSAAART